MKKFDNITAIEILYKRLLMSKKLDDIVIATARNGLNLNLINFCKKKKLNIFRGRK